MDLRLQSAITKSSYYHALLGQGVILTTGQPCLSLPHTHYPHSSCFLSILGWKHRRNWPIRHKLPMKRILPDIFLTILMEFDPPTILPCIVHIVRRIFLPFTVSHFDIPGSKGPTTQAKNVKIILFFPQNRAGLMMCTKNFRDQSFAKKCHSVEVFGQACTWWGYFFWHFSLLAPDNKQYRSTP